jgi:hypothetical protein
MPCTAQHDTHAGVSRKWQAPGIVSPATSKDIDKFHLSTRFCLVGVVLVNIQSTHGALQLPEHTQKHP